MLKHFKFGREYLGWGITWLFLISICFSQGTDGVSLQEAGAAFPGKHAGLNHVLPVGIGQKSGHNHSPEGLLPGIRRLVPQQYPTIQAGIDAAVNGDTVLVADGYYFENIRFKGKAITVASYFIVDGDTNHINNTAINGSSSTHPDSGSVVYFIAGEDTNSVLTGFTITGGTGTKFLMSGTIQCTGGGIFLWSGGKIEWNKVVSNHLNTTSPRYTHGAGMDISVETDAVIRNNLIAYNVINAWWGGGAGVVMGCTDTSSILFEDNTITDNIYSADEGLCAGGFYLFGGPGWQGRFIFQNNLIKRNEVHSTNVIYGMGGGIYVESASPEILNNIIAENMSSGGGGGVFVGTNSAGNPGNPIIINNTIINNTARTGGGLYIDYRTNHPLVMNTILWGNRASQNADEIFQGANSQLTIINSNIAGGEWSNINMGRFDIPPCFCTGSCNLEESSPCIGVGLSSYTFGNITYNAPPFDFSGRRRPARIDDRVDIGAHESIYGCKAYPDSFTCSLTPPVFIHPQSDSFIVTSRIQNPHNRNVNISATILSADSVDVISCPMFDDGNHHDRAANDGWYGAMVGPVGVENEFNRIGITVEDPATSSHITFNNNISFTTAGPVVLDDFMPGTGFPFSYYYDIPFTLVLRNLASVKTVENVYVTVQSTDPNVHGFRNNGQNLGNIAPGQAVVTPQQIIMHTLNLNSIDTVDLTVNIYGNGHLYWQEDLAAVVGIEEKTGTLPAHFALSQNYPNPFNPATVISWQLPVGSMVKLSVYDVLGKEVTVLVNEKRGAGFYQTTFDGNGMSSGVYLYRLEAVSPSTGSRQGFVETRKMVLMR